MSQIEGMSDAVVSSAVDSITIDGKEAPVKANYQWLFANCQRVSFSKNAVCLNVPDRGHV
jgi:hypothetical protein